MSSLLIAAEQIQPGRIEPQPLFKDLPEPEPFPMDALCRFSGAAMAMQRVIKAPDAICGQSILAGLALVAQAHADISIDGRRRPISCFFATVGETGERKSAVDDVATWPHSKYERNLESEHLIDHREWEMEHRAWKQSRDDDLKK
jgi:putative DNA primase/helicase